MSVACLQIPNQSELLVIGTADLLRAFAFHEAHQAIRIHVIDIAIDELQDAVIVQLHDILLNIQIIEVDDYGLIIAIVINIFRRERKFAEVRKDRIVIEGLQVIPGETLYFLELREGGNRFQHMRIRFVVDDLVINVSVSRIRAIDFMHNDGIV